MSLTLPLHPSALLSLSWVTPMPRVRRKRRPVSRAPQGCTLRTATKVSPYCVSQCLSACDPPNANAVCAHWAGHEAALEKALQLGGTKLRRSKIMYVGEGRAGKSALFEAMLKNMFQIAGHASTVGIDLMTCKVLGIISKAGVVTLWKQVCASSHWNPSLAGAASLRLVLNVSIQPH